MPFHKNTHLCHKRILTKFWIEKFIRVKELNNLTSKEMTFDFKFVVSMEFLLNSIGHLHLNDFELYTSLCFVIFMLKSTVLIPVCTRLTFLFTLSLLLSMILIGWRLAHISFDILLLRVNFFRMIFRNKYFTHIAHKPFSNVNLKSYF